MVLFQRKSQHDNGLNVNYGGDELESGRWNAKPEMPYVHTSYANNRRPNNSNSKKGASPKIAITQFIIIGILSILSFRSHREVNNRRSQINVLYVDYQNTQKTLSGLEDELDKAHEDFHKLQMSLLAEHAAMPNIHHSEFTEDHRENVANNIILKHDKQAERITQLQNKIKEYHQQELKRRFGEGPYFVEFQINLDGQQMWFTLEMAPSEVMPHSVYFFMDMVDKKIWDNTVFMHNNEHILSSVLATPQGEDKRPLVKSKLAFPEYSDKFQHEKFTFGFANVGPEFYLNIMDNSVNHGPGGESLQDGTLNDADPCFARVIIGAETLDQMQKKSHDHKDEEEHVFSLIETIRIIPLSQERLRELGITPMM